MEAPESERHGEEEDGNNVDANEIVHGIQDLNITEKTENETAASQDIAEQEVERRDELKSSDYDLTITQELIDGTDSGVEVVPALSSNGSNSDRVTPAQSCGSSLVSCYSEPEADRGSECGSECSSKSHLKKTPSDASSKCSDKCSAARGDRTRATRKVNYDGHRTSESCSETSSTYEAQTCSTRSTDFNRSISTRLLVVKKAEHKTSSVRRTESMPRSTNRERVVVRSQTGARSSVGTVSKSRGKPVISTKPDVKGSRLKVDNDDGRWPSSAQKNGARSRGTSAVDPARARTAASSSNTMSSSAISALSMTSSFGSATARSAGGESKSTALEKYGTLPRRPKKRSSEALEVSSAPSPAGLPRSSSVSREPSLNRAATLRRQQSKEKDSPSIGNGKSLPPYPRGRRSAGKTLIYHEVSIQTNLTSEDVQNALAGVAIPDRTVEPVEKVDKAIQSEGKDRLKKLEESFAQQAEELERTRKENERYRLEKEAARSRICRILGVEEKEGEEVGLEKLEQHFQAVGRTVIRQKEELSELRHFKTVAQRDLEKSFAAQKNLLQQQQEIEAEFVELQEFLQAEKSTLSESLVDTEEEIQTLYDRVSSKQGELDQQQAECKHLVRICEQRRQENLSLEAKLSGLEQRSRDVLLQQGAAVSGAAVALSGLGARLDSLVEQLSMSYNVSEKDLEDVIFHNEAYTQSQSEESSDISPDGPVPQPTITDLHASPKRGASFLNAVLGAIRNATQSSFAPGRKSPPSLTQADQSSESLGLLDSELEPCLILETVFEEDSGLPLSGADSSGCSAPRDDDPVTIMEPRAKLCHSDSLQNLSAAILARQQVERDERGGSWSPDAMLPVEVNSLVDQVVDVDNLVTKLLKVLRIVQLENDTCVDQLHDQRVDLSDKLHQEHLYRQRTEDNLQRLQHELKEARSQLNSRILQLEEAKTLLSDNWRAASAESQRQYATIDHALETLHSIQDLVDQYPPLAKLQQDLEDCNFRTAAGDDLNANSPSNGNVDNAKEVGHASVLTTAI